MRVTKQKAEANRRAIVEAATELVRQRGADAVSISDVTKAAGFTHGGFYNHFASKDDLIVAAFDAAFAEYLTSLSDALDGEDSAQAFKNALAAYLSPSHRDNPQTGCPTAALVTDAIRSPNAVQDAYARGVEGYLRLFAEQFAEQRPNAGDPNGGDPRARAMRALSELVGSMVLARAVAHADPQLADDVLAASRAAMKG